MMLNRKRISAIMIMVLTLSQISVESFGADVSDKLLNLNVTVEQNGDVIEESDWETINTEENINLSFSLRVPVQGDGIFDAFEVVNHNDTAGFELAKGFTLNSGVGPFELNFGGKKVGTLTVSSDDANKTVAANITFDGDEDIFSGNEWSNVEIAFNANISYDRTGNDVDGGDYTVYFLEKAFDITVPSLPVEVTGEKTGIRDGQFIDWKVRLVGKKGDVLTDLEGYTFKDNLNGVGRYVPGSFKLNTLDDSDTATLIDPDFTSEVAELSYVFPNGSNTEQYIFFRTQIEDAVFLSNGNKTITNSGKLYEEADEVWSDDASVLFTVEWIKKEGAITNFVAETNTGEMTWTITANQLGATLNNAVITDELDEKLDFVSAHWATYIEGAWVSQGAITPDEDSEYALGHVSTPIQLTIKTKVKEHINIGHTVLQITNNASITWDGLDGTGIGTGNINVNIGLNPIHKTAGVYNKSTHTIPWTIEVEKSDVDVDLRVMDLLVYGNSGFNVNNIGSAYTIESNADSGLNQVSDDDFKNLTPSYNQKYKPVSFTTVDGLEMKVYTIKDTNGNAVADLLVVTNAGVLGIDVTGGSPSFSFETIVTNPAIYAKNGNTTVRNHASLFSANTLINRDDASVNYASRILIKDMLTRENAVNPDANKNSGASNITRGFNYEDKTVTYRLHVNGNNITDLTNDMTTVDGVSLGAITLTDTLPSGWEFIEIDNGKMFKIYEGTGNSDGTVTSGDEPANLDFITEDFSVMGEVTFSLSSLTKPYVILLKAKPNDATIDSYFDANKTTTPRNNVMIKSANWNTGASDYEDVRVISQILGKTLERSEGVLTWTVEYKPYDIERTGLSLEDTIPYGIELRTDSEGVLDLIDDNIVVTKLKLKSDGTYEENESVTLELGPEGNLSYDSISRVMTFLIPENEADEGYRIVYKTDITGEPGTTINNSVKLIGGGVTSDPVDTSYVVQSADASATMTRSGWIEITKTNYSNNSPLSDATFEIRTESGNAFRSGTTDVDGKVILRGLPVGNYTLIETSPPDGFNLLSKTYAILVYKDGDVVKTSIDEKSGIDSNKTTITNIQTGTIGGIEIKKNIAGNAASATKEFDFEISITGLPNGDYAYVGSGGKTNGNLTFVDRIATFTLRGGESITILNLPKDLQYEVTESDYTSDRYRTTKSNDIGVVEADATQLVIFTNSRSTSGGGTLPEPELPVEEPDPSEPEIPVEPEIPETPEEPEEPEGEVIIGEIDVPEGGTITIVEGPENGDLEMDEDGNWIYKPDPQKPDGNQFIVIVKDPDGNEEMITIDLDDPIIPEGLLELPRTGGVPVGIYLTLGGILVVIGIVLKRRRI